MTPTDEMVLLCVTLEVMVDKATVDVTNVDIGFGMAILVFCVLFRIIFDVDATAVLLMLFRTAA